MIYLIGGGHDISHWRWIFPWSSHVGIYINACVYTYAYVYCIYILHADVYIHAYVYIQYIYTYACTHMHVYWVKYSRGLRHGTWQLPPWSPPWISLFDTTRDSKLINPASNTDMKVNNIYIYKPNITPTRPNIYPHVFLLAQYVEPFARRKKRRRRWSWAFYRLQGTSAMAEWRYNSNLSMLYIWCLYI